MLDSLVNQTMLPKKVIVVNDNSSDATEKIISEYSKKHQWINGLTISSSAEHIPGSKVVNAFYKGFETLDNNYDIICKFDADIILPPNYLEVICAFFKSDETIGIAGGLAYIKKDNQWIYETIASKNHVRGPFKAYRKACFEAIGGLKTSIGWDTIDVLLAQYYDWKVKTDATLHIKHLKPTGKTYHKSSRYLHGEALYKMRLGFSLTLLSALKSAVNKKSLPYFFNMISGYLIAKKKNTAPLVTLDQGQFIRQLRWNGILEKLNLKKKLN
jgi:cellulose synthase/poly-beta-1,6-N-acetylglucosamine synthase-like glycosyltransferase